MVEAVLFIGAVVAGITQLLKFVKDKAWDKVATVGLALLSGLLVAVLDVHIGVEDITIAQGLMTAFGAVGAYGLAEKIG